MRNVVMALAVLIVVGCSGEVTTESVQLETDAVTFEVDDDRDRVDDEDDAASPTAIAAAPAPEPAATEAPVPDETAASNDGLFPTVVDAVASTSNGETWKVDVTLSSEYDSPARYADAWRVLDGDDIELGIRVLGHDHANEQPFTRSTSVVIPAEVETVYIEGRDQLNGWSGERFELTLER